MEISTIVYILTTVISYSYAKGKTGKFCEMNAL